MREKKKDWDHSVVSAAALWAADSNIAIKTLFSKRKTVRNVQPPCLFLQDILFLSNITITPLWAELCRLVCVAVLHDIFIKLWAAGGAVEMFRTGSLALIILSKWKNNNQTWQRHKTLHDHHTVGLTCSLRSLQLQDTRTRSEPGLLGNGVSSDNRDVSDRIKPASVFRLVRRRDAELKKRRFNLSPGRWAASVWRWTWSNSVKEPLMLHTERLKKTPHCHQQEVTHVWSFHFLCLTQTCTFEQ